MEMLRRPVFYGPKLLVVLILVVLSMVSGCSNTKNLALNDRQNIGSISISPANVKYSFDWEATLVLNTSSKAWAAGIGGVIGSGIYESYDEHGREKKIIQFLKADSMLQKTVSEAFDYQFKNSGLFKVISGGEAAARLEVEVVNLQFHELYGNNLKFTGQYWARLYDINNGALLWASRDQYAAWDGDLIEYTLVEFTSEPAKLRYALSVLSQMLAGDFVEDLDGQRLPINHDLHNVASYRPRPVKDLVQVGGNDVAMSSEPNDATMSNNTTSQLSPVDMPDNKAEAKLIRLKKMYDKGLITEGEYEKERTEVLEDF